MGAERAARFVPCDQTESSNYPNSSISVSAQGGAVTEIRIWKYHRSRGSDVVRRTLGCAWSSGLRFRPIDCFALDWERCPSTA